MSNIIGRMDPKTGLVEPLTDGTAVKAVREMIQFPSTEETRRRLEDAATGSGKLYEENLRGMLDTEERLAEGQLAEIKLARANAKYYNRRAEHYRKAIPSYTIGWGLVGFICGLVFAVSQVLQNHGPTVTIMGTIGAFALYALGGTIFTGLFGWLGHEHASDMADNCAAKADDFAEQLAMAETQYARHLRNVETYASELRHHQYHWLFDET